MLLAGFLLLTVFLLIGDRRRAIIFTDRTVVYRPMVSAPHVIAFGKITGLRRVHYYKTSLGVALDLPEGMPEVWPLCFGDQREILERLKTVTGKPVIDRD
jgi:hypothetical protein